MPGGGADGTSLVNRVSVWSDEKVLAADMVRAVHCGGGSE